MLRRDGSRVRCFTKNGHGWADRFPAIVKAALLIKATSFMIDGEAVIARDDGMPSRAEERHRRDDGPSPWRVTQLLVCPRCAGPRRMVGAVTVAGSA